MPYCSRGSVVKKLSLPKKGLVFGLLAGRKHQSSWNARPDRNVFVCLGALSITLGSKNKLSPKFTEFSSGAVGRLVSHLLDHMALGPHSPTYGRGLT